MGEEHQDQWMRKLPWVILGRRTSYHEDLQATPATVVFGEDPKLPGDLGAPVGEAEDLAQLLERVRQLPHRPPAQTNLRKEAKVYMPPSTELATHVYTKNPKKTPLGARYLGPYPIEERQGKSCIKIITGYYKNNGKPRTEIRHWNTCYPAPLGCESAVKPPLGRKPQNS